MELRQLERDIDRGERISDISNSEVAQTPVNLFYCPSDQARDELTFILEAEAAGCDENLPVPISTSNYVGVMGDNMIAIEI